MVDLSKITEDALIEHAKDYVHRMNDLHTRVYDYVCNREGNQQILRDEYATLKREIKEEAKYLSASRNSIRNRSDVHNAYEAGILECSAWGFTAKSNAKLSANVLRSLEEARYKLTKYTRKFND